MSYLENLDAAWEEVAASLERRGLKIRRELPRGWCFGCCQVCRGRSNDGFCYDADRAEIARRQEWVRTGVYPALAEPQPALFGGAE